MSEPNMYYPWKCICPPNGWFSTYAHLDKVYVKVGQYVHKGTLIGEIGPGLHTTTVETWPNWSHLHFGIEIEGWSINLADVFSLNSIPTIGYRYAPSPLVDCPKTYPLGIERYMCFILPTLIPPVDLSHCNWVNVFNLGGENNLTFHEYNYCYYDKDWQCFNDPVATEEASVYCMSGGKGVISQVTNIINDNDETGSTVYIRHSCYECQYCDINTTPEYIIVFLAGFEENPGFPPTTECTDMNGAWLCERTSNPCIYYYNQFSEPPLWNPVPWVSVSLNEDNVFVAYAKDNHAHAYFRGDYPDNDELFPLASHDCLRIGEIIYYEVQFPPRACLGSPVTCYTVPWPPHNT